MSRNTTPCSTSLTISQQHRRKTPEHNTTRNRNHSNLFTFQITGKKIVKLIAFLFLLFHITEQLITMFFKHAAA
jgi:hypothetical protein